MPQTIWTVIARSEIGSMIFPQDTASCTDKVVAAKFMETWLEVGADLLVLEISDHGIVDVTADMIEFCAAEYFKRNPDADPEQVDAWMKDTKAFDDHETEWQESQDDGEAFRRNPDSYYGAPSRI